MSDLFSNFVNGIFGSEGYMRSPQHASRLYRDDNLYDFAPKAGWLYYVVMNINPDFAVSREMGQRWQATKKPVVGILAKDVQLPTFKISTEVLNQYNRKTVVQTKLNYDPITITWHDDMGNATTDLWKNYYQYYYADSKYASGNRFGSRSYGPFNLSFSDTKTGSQNYKYGFNKPHEVPFFSQIEIYQLNKQQYNCIRLINPILTSWQHGQMGQGAPLLESKMTVAYDNVVYDAGTIKKNLKELKQNHYDVVPSPLGAGSGIFGAITGASDLIEGVSGLNKDSSFLDVVGVGIQATNLAKTAKTITKDSLKAEGYSIIAGGIGLAARGGGNLVTGVSAFNSGGGGINGTVNLFKQLSSSNSSINGATIAAPRKGL